MNKDQLDKPVAPAVTSENPSESSSGEGGSGGVGVTVPGCGFTSDSHSSDLEATK